MSTHTLPDDMTLLAMDGPALAHVAYEIGLAPAWVIPETIGVYPSFWHPWRSQQDADAVLQILQAKGVPTQDIWTGTVGHLQMDVHQVFSARYTVDGTHPVDEIKPLALLRCAVRAWCWRLRHYGEKTP